MIDLHLHTFHSDGALSPAELLLKAKELGMSSVSISDHDTVSAIVEAERLAGELGIELIRGIEITSSYRQHQLHFLGYFFDPTDSKFLSRLEQLRHARVNRVRRIIAKLNRIKIPLKLESVLERAGTHDSIGRPHIANTMIEEGFAETYEEAFHKYLGIGRPAYEANHPFPPEDAISMVAEAGGLSFIAHPSHYVSDEILRYLMKIGVDGIEVVHPSHSKVEMEHYRKFAEDNSMLKCGGSDFHGGMKNDDENLGKFVADPQWVEEMLERIGRRVR